MKFSSDGTASRGGVLKRLAMVLAAACLLQTTPQTHAVSNGVPDAGEHPYVGLAVFFDADGNPLWRGSCSALSPTVLLTAGHCTAGAASARIWFQDTITDPFYPFFGGPSVEGTVATHPAYTFTIDSPDLGVIILSEPLVLPRYAQLPSPGLLNQLATSRGTQDQSFTIVGYGLQGIRPVFSADLIRTKGATQLITLKSALTDGANIQLTGGPGKGHGSGGIIFGDSGGPTLLGNSDLVVGVNSFVLNQLAKGPGFASRVDRLLALDWINLFLQE